MASSIVGFVADINYCEQHHTDARLAKKASSPRAVVPTRSHHTSIIVIISIRGPTVAKAAVRVESTVAAVVEHVESDVATAAVRVKSLSRHLVHAIIVIISFTIISCPPLPLPPLSLRPSISHPTTAATSTIPSAVHGIAARQLCAQSDCGGGVRPHAIACARIHGEKLQRILFFLNVLISTLPQALPCPAGTFSPAGASECEASSFFR